MVKEGNGRVFRQRVAGGVILVPVVAQWVILMGLIANFRWADVAASLLFGGKNDSGIFLIVSVVGLTVHGVFAAFAGVWPAQKVSRALGLAWGIEVSVLVVFSVVLGAERLGMDMDDLRIGFGWGVFIGPVALACFMLAGRSDGRGLMRRQAWLLSVCALFFVLQCGASVVLAAPSVSRSGVRDNVHGLVRAMPTAMLMVSALVLWFGRGRYRRMRMEMEGGIYCFGCEYDLTGTFAAGGGVCPECGVEARGEQVERWRADAV
jgi:hypothetical protein